jgi:DNA-binding NarL/FixJ family response regulator
MRAVTKCSGGGILRSMSSSVRVLVVEDDTLTRSTMAAALTGNGMNVVGEAATAAAAIRIFAEIGADVALIDLDLGSGPTGIDLAVELRNRNPSVGLIILTSFDDPRLLNADLPEMPPGTIYLRKKQVSSIKDVKEAIENARRMPGNSANISEIRSHDLTDGNAALLRDIARGLTNAQIAELRGVSVSAVEKSIRRLANSLGISESTGNQRALLIQSYLRMTGRDVRS